MYLNTHTYNLHSLNLPSIHPHYKQQKQRNCPQCKRGTCSPSFVFLVWPVCFIAFPSLKSEAHPMLGEKVTCVTIFPHLYIPSKCSATRHSGSCAPTTEILIWFVSSCRWLFPRGEGWLVVVRVGRWGWGIIISCSAFKNNGAIST